MRQPSLCTGHLSGLVAHASNAEWWLLSQERTALFRKGGASGKAVNYRHTQPKTVFWGAFFEMLVTQNVKVGKEDLCNKLEAPTEKLYLSGGMLTVVTQ